MIRLLLVEDHPVLRQAMEMRLSLEPDLAVVGVAIDGQAALTCAQELKPDVIIMDIHMPRMDGIAATYALHTIAPHSAVILQSLDDDMFTRLSAQAAGAVAFVSKPSPTSELLQVIRQAAQSASSSSAGRAARETVGAALVAA